MAGTQKIKFPVLNDVEYFDVIQNKTVIKSFKKSDLEGLKWRQIQEKIGKFATGSIHYTFKFNNNPEIHKGMMRVINTDQNTSDASPALVNKLTNEISDLKDKLNNAASGGGVSVDLLLNITRQSYETQISFLNNEINRKDLLITKLENTIEKLNNELSIQDETIQSLQSKTGLNQYLPLIQAFVNKKLPGAAPVTTLKDSNTSDVPPRILELLGAIDWNKVEPNIISEIIKYLEIFINQLPMKG